MLEHFSDQPSVRLSLPPSLCHDLPALACRWLDQVRSGVVGVSKFVFVIVLFVEFVDSTICVCVS